MSLTKRDLEEMMKKQKEERKDEMKMLKSLLMEGVREEIKEQLTSIRAEVDEKVAAVREEFENKISDVEGKHTEMSDIQSVLDCKVDKLEEEMKTLRDMTKNRFSDRQSDPTEGNSLDNSEDIGKLVDFALKVVGFKPIENRDVLRHKRMHDIDDEEEAKRSCLKEFWRCEMRMPTTIVEELLENIVKVWNSSEDDWDKLYVEFKDEKSVKVCYSYCKFLRKIETQIVQFFPPEFREQYRTLDSIAYKLRRPDNTYDIKYKTRIRFAQHGLALEKRHPEQRNWIRVPVQHLPPVDLQPVPLPTASSSPPSERSRDNKRPRSPQISPPAERPNKNSKIVNSDRNISFENAQDSFVFKNLVDKFASR